MNKWLIIWVVMIGCAPDSTNEGTITIKLDPEGKGHRTPKINIIHIIPLETINSSIFNSSIKVEFYNERIYLLDINGKSLLMFDQKGNFLKKTHVGHGPGEMVNPFSFFIDRENDEVLIHDQTLRKLFTYDLKLDYKSHRDFSVFVEDFARINEKFLVLGINGLENAHSYNLYGKNPDSVIINQETGFDTKEGSLLLARPISLSKTNLLLIAPLNYHIYEFNEETISPKYYIDCGSKALTDNEISRGLEDVLDLIGKGIKVTSPNEISESENYISFYLNYRPSLHYLISKATNEVLFMNPLFEDKTLPMGRIRGTTGRGDEFYLEVKAQDLIKYQEVTGKKLTDQEIDEESNPVFVVFEVDG